MKRNRVGKKDAAAIVLARVTNEKLSINDGDISSLISSMQSLQQQVVNLSADLEASNITIGEMEVQISLMGSTITNLSNDLATANNLIATLSASYDNHVHGYTDVIQDASVVNKITNTPT